MASKRLYFKTTFFTLLILLAGCEVQKRKYQPGFHISHKGNLHQAKINDRDFIKPETFTKSSPSANPRSSFLFAEQKLYAGGPDSCATLVFNDGTEIKAKVIEINDKEVRYQFCDDPESAIRVSRRATVVNIRYANQEKPAPPRQEEFKEEPVQVSKIVDSVATVKNQPNADTNKINQTCDKIVFRDGTERLAKISEIGVTEVRFKSCDMPNGPEFVRSKSSIFMIVYPNGQREVFKDVPVETRNVPAVEPARYVPPPPRKVGLAVTAFIFSLLGIFPLVYGIGSVPALIMAQIYLNKAEREPEVYTATSLAKAAKIISLVVIGIYLSVIILALAGL